MKAKLILVLLIIFFQIGFIPIDPVNYSARNFAPNQISTWFVNDGSVNSMFDSNNTAVGFEWPKNSHKFAISTAGLWIGCKVHDSLRLAIAFAYPNEFYPGYTDYNTQSPQGKNDSAFRIYKVSPLFPSGGNGFDSWSIWPVSQGAAWFDNNHNGIYEPPTDRPLMESDENMFCAYTDSYIESHTNYAGSTKPMNADVHLYCYGSTNPQCADAIYMEWTIINKKNFQWDSLFVALWADPDLGDPSHDKTGCDTNLNIGFNYNDTIDYVYGALHPAFSYGIYEVSRHSGKLMDIFNDPKKNLYEPVNASQTWSVLQGRKNDNSNWINPINNQVSKLLYTGDPETGSGWLYRTGFSNNHGNDTRMLLGSYIGTVVPLDTIRFCTVAFIKSGLNDSNAVTQIKNCYHQGVIGINSNSSIIPNRFSLYQNYPNPFNPNTVIKFQIVNLSDSKLIIYNALGQEIATIVNEELKPGTYSVQWNAVNYPSGVYFYKLIVGENTNNGGFTETKKMVLIK